MGNTAETQVLIAGGGPVGMTAAIELARRGIACCLVDPLMQPLQYAKAVGVQPRTLEVFEGMGVLRRILDAAVPMYGQIVYVNRKRVTQLDLTLPADVPFGYLVRREAQLLIDYADSPIVTRAGAPATSDTRAGAPATSNGRGADGRAPDATGLTRDAVTAPVRLFSLLSGREHTTLRYAPDGPVDVAAFERAAVVAVDAAQGRMDVYVVAAAGADIPMTALPVIRDTDGDFARAYAPGGPAAYIVRPDGYLGAAGIRVDPEDLVTHLRATFARRETGGAG